MVAIAVACATVGCAGLRSKKPKPVVATAPAPKDSPLPPIIKQAKQHFEQHEYEKVVALLDGTIQDRKALAEHFYFLALSYLNLAQLPECERVLNRASERYGDYHLVREAMAQYQYVVGRLRLEDGDLEAAHEAFRQGLAHVKDDAAFQNKVAVGYCEGARRLVAQGRRPAAIQALEQAMTMLPGEKGLEEELARIKRKGKSRETGTQPTPPPRTDPSPAQQAPQAPPTVIPSAEPQAVVSEAGGIPPGRPGAALSTATRETPSTQSQRSLPEIVPSVPPEVSPPLPVPSALPVVSTSLPVPSSPPAAFSSLPASPPPQTAPIYGRSVSSSVGPKDSAASVELAREALSRNDAAGAAAILKRTLSTDPPNNEAKLSLFESFVRLGLKAEAEDVFSALPAEGNWREQAAALRNMDGVPSDSTAGLLRLAEAYRRAGLFRDSLGAYERVKDSFSGNPKALIGYGEVLEKMGRSEDGRVAYQAALDAGGDEESIRLKLGASCFFARQYPAAIDQYRKALEVNPKNPKTYFDLADILHSLKEYQTEREVFGHLLDQNISPKINRQARLMMKRLPAAIEK